MQSKSHIVSMTDHKTTYNNSLQNYADVETTNQQTKALDKALT